MICNEIFFKFNKIDIMYTMHTEKIG